MSEIRASIRPLMVVAAIVALLLQLMQPVMAICDASRQVANEIAVEAFCGHQPAPQKNDSQQALHCKICHVCCLGHADVAAAPGLPVPTWQAWFPQSLVRATPVRGPPVIQARARSPPASS